MVAFRQEIHNTVLQGTRDQLFRREIVRRPFQEAENIINQLNNII